MIDISLVIIILLIHWFADFVLQTSEEAEEKSKRIDKLLDHTLTYSTFWFFASIPIMLVYDLPYKFMWFAAITFFFHTVTDYYTSKLNRKLWKDKRVHSFFVAIGFDQWLHYLQLFLTYWYLSK